MNEDKKIVALPVNATLSCLNQTIKFYENKAFKADYGIQKKCLDKIVEEKKNQYKWVQRFYQYVVKNKDMDDFFSELEQQRTVVFSNDFLNRFQKLQEEIPFLDFLVEQEQKLRIDYQGKSAKTQEPLLRKFYEMMVRFAQENYAVFSKMQEYQKLAVD